MVMKSRRAIQNGPGCGGISQRRLRSLHLRLNSPLGRYNDYYLGFSFWPAEVPQVQATALHDDASKCSNQGVDSYNL